MNKEPALIISGIVAALIALYVAFGGELTQQQQDAILGLVAIVGPLVAGVIIRQNVYSPETFKREKALAFNSGRDHGERGTTVRAVVPGEPRSYA